MRVCSADSLTGRADWPGRPTVRAADPRLCPISRRSRTAAAKNITIAVNYPQTPANALLKPPARPHLSAMLHIADNLVLADWEMSEQFTRSQGPGGQNVNKVSTAVELRFEAARSPHLTDAVKARLRRLAGRRWTADGAVLITVQDTRSQARNREIARERLAALVRQALVAPRKRIATRPTLGSQRRRLAAKTLRGTVKTLRGSVSAAEE